MTISKRKLRRYELAERVCRATRFALTNPQTKSDDVWAEIASTLISWLKLAGKEGFAPPRVLKHSK